MINFLKNCGKTWPQFRLFFGQHGTFEGLRMDPGSALGVVGFGPVPGPTGPYGSNKGLKMGPTKFKTNSKTLRIWGPRARGEAQGANHPRNERLVIVSLSACPPPAYLHVCIFSLDSFVGRFFVPFLRLFDLVYFVISSCPLCIYLSRSLNHCTSVSRSSRVSAPPAKSNTTYIR